MKIDFEKLSTQNTLRFISAMNVKKKIQALTQINPTRSAKAIITKTKIKNIEKLKQELQGTYKQEL